MHQDIQHVLPEVQEGYPGKDLSCVCCRLHHANVLGHLHNVIVVLSCLEYVAKCVEFGSVLCDSTYWCCDRLALSVNLCVVYLAHKTWIILLGIWKCVAVIHYMYLLVLNKSTQHCLEHQNRTKGNHC